MHRKEKWLYQIRFQNAWVRVRVKVFNATFNDVSVISWRSVLLVKETGVPGENHLPATSHLALIGIRTHISGDRN